MKEAGELPSYHDQYDLKVGAKVASQWPYSYREAMLPSDNKYDSFTHKPYSKVVHNYGSTVKATMPEDHASTGLQSI